MNIELIKFNEHDNDGQQVHVYYDKIMDMWMAFGYSAFSLRLFIKKRGYDCLCALSSEMKLPCTVVSGPTMNIVRNVVKVTSRGEEYECYEFPEAFDSNDYIRWTNKLKEEEEFKMGMLVNTLVSDKVPKDCFIPDCMSAFSRNVKRIGDCIISLIAMIVFSPLFVWCYIMVKKEDGGPAIFKQERIGRFGSTFYIYKFRSMRMDAEMFGPQLSHSGGVDDPRLTKIGRFIRAHHLDELPQLWNVFVGDMALIGPRPERKFYIDQIMEYDKRYAYLYQIRPGVTSYATLYNGYTDTMQKMLCRLEYDLYYLSKRSFLFDFKILVKTFCSIVFGKKF